MAVQEGTPVRRGAGVAITDGKGNIIKEYSHFLGVKTNNEAEYEAVIFGLRKIKSSARQRKKIKIRKLSFGWIAS